MIKHFVPTSTPDYDQVCDDLGEEWEDYWMHMGEWEGLSDERIPSSLSTVEVEKRADEIAIEDVFAWVQKHNGLEGRIRFLQTYMSDSRLFQMVILPLLSMRTTGSIDVERVAKPFKHNILRKERNRLSDEKRDAFFFVLHRTCATVSKSRWL